MDKKILEYIRKSKPNKTLKEALNELPEEISKYFSEGDRKRKEDELLSCGFERKLCRKNATALPLKAWILS